MKAVIQDNGKLAMYDAEDQLVWCNDSEWSPEYPRINAVAIENATVLLPGDQIGLGQTKSSNNSHWHLTLNNSGNLLLTEEKLPWTRIWGADQYEPDAHVASTYGTSPSAVFEGWLYWGTMHVPSAALIKYEFSAGEQDTLDRAKYILGSLYFF